MNKSLLFFFCLTISFFNISFNDFYIKPAINSQAMICTWQLVQEIPHTSVASTAPEASSSMDGNTVNIVWEGLYLTHTWTHPGNTLIPGEEMYFEVSVAWSKDSDATLGSIGGVNTNLNFNWVDSVKARRSSINFDTEPSGFVSNDIIWTVPVGAEGRTLEIIGSADAAVAGGNVRYKYQWQCATPEPSPEPESSSTPEASPTPRGVYRILVLPKGDKDPLKLTLRLEQQVEGSFQPVSGAELRVSALSYEGNEARLADEFLAPACINCDWREVSGERLAHLAHSEQPVILQSNEQGEAEIAFFLDFAKLGASVPRRNASLNIPIAVEYLGTGEDGEIILAETDYVVVLDAIGVVTAVTYQQAQMFDVGLNPLPVNGGSLDSYFDDPGTRDGPRMLYRGQRVLVDWPGKDSIYPTGATPGEPLQAGVLLHSGDRVTINACDMVSNRMVDGLPAGAPGVVWVKVRFFDGTRAKVGVNGSICKTTVTFGDTPQASGWFNTSEKFFYWTSNGALNAAIGYYLWPYKIVSGISSIGKALAWVTGNESAGWSTVYVEIKSALWVEFDETGAMRVTTREGEPIVYIESGGEYGMPVPAGQTAYLSPGFQTVDIQITDNEIANQADALLAELNLPEEDAQAVSSQESTSAQGIASLLPTWALAVLGGVACLATLGAVGVGGGMLLAARKRQRMSPAQPAVSGPPRPVRAASAGAGWALEVVGGPDRGRRIMLGQHIRLGRKTDNDLPLNDKLVSSYHAHIQIISGVPVVTDLNSRNGTCVNGVQISQPTRLGPGDQLLVGNTLLRVVAER